MIGRFFRAMDQDFRQSNNTFWLYSPIFLIFFTLIIFLIHGQTNIAFLISFFLLICLFVFSIFQRDFFSKSFPSFLIYQFLINAYLLNVLYHTDTTTFFTLYFSYLLLSFIHKDRIHFSSSFLLNLIVLSLSFLLDLIPVKILPFSLLATFFIAFTAYVFHLFLSGIVKELIHTRVSYKTSEAQLRNLFLDMRDSVDVLHEFGVNIQESIDSGNQLAHETKTFYHDVTIGMRDQNKNLDDLKRTIDTIEGSISTISRYANETKNLTDGTVKSIDKGNRNMDTLETRIKKTEQLVRDILQSMVGLQIENRKIDTILSTIHEVSNHTDLLAINVSIEAVQSGGENSGFSVLADEVKRLAENSKESVLEISYILNEIKDRTNELVKQGQYSQSALKESLEALHDAKESFQTSSQNTLSVSRHADTLNEQSFSLVQNSARLSNEMNNISSVSEQIGASVTNIQEMVERQHQIMNELSNQYQNVQRQTNELKRFTN